MQIFNVDSTILLKGIRKAYKLTQAEFAQIAGISQSEVRSYEKGEKDVKKVLLAQHLLNISAYFGISSDFILGILWERLI